MKKTLFIFLVMGILACFAGTALAAAASGQSNCPPKGGAQSRDAVDKYYAEAFNGANPRAYDSPEVFKETATLMDDFYKKMSENTENSANQSSDAMQTMLDQCIAGINMNIFDGGLAGMWDAIVAAVKKKMCNFALQQSSQYLNAALDQMQIELPMGLGTVGANTNVLGYTMSSTGQTTAGKMQGIVKSPSVQKDAGFTMFQNGGSLMMNNSGVKLPF